MEEPIDIIQEADAFPEEDGAQHVCLVIKRSLPNRRIDKYLHHRFPDFSRTIIQRLIEEGAVTVNGKPPKSSYHLHLEDQVNIILPPPPTNEIPPEPIPLDILYEDDDMMVLNKPSNLIVHPARGNRGGTLVNGLVYYSDTLSQVNGQFRPGIVHRLDRDTSGVIVVAKTDTAHWRLAHQFEHRSVTKIYLAIVQGTMALDADVVAVPLGRHPRVREKYAARPESGKHAVTKYQTVKQYRGYAFVKLYPKTGRTHQLRVHMSYVKHPIVGDTMYEGKVVTLGQLANGAALPEPGQLGYGMKEDDLLMTRQALHASELHLRHPVTAEPMVFTAPVPADMSLFLALLDRYRCLG